MWGAVNPQGGSGLEGLGSGCPGDTEGLLRLIGQAYYPHVSLTKVLKVLRNLLKC